MKNGYNAYVMGYKHNKYCISLNYEGKRLRFYTGAAIGIDSYPNKLPENQRKRAAIAAMQNIVLLDPNANKNPTPLKGNGVFISLSCSTEV